MCIYHVIAYTTSLYEERRGKREGGEGGKGGEGREGGKGGEGREGGGKRGWKRQMGLGEEESWYSG